LRRSSHIDECKRLGFDIIEISSGFISIPTTIGCVWSRRCRRPASRPAGSGDSFRRRRRDFGWELEGEGTRDPKWAIQQAKRFIDADAYRITIESEPITENIKTWRSDVIAALLDTLGLDKLMFEAADPGVFAWYIKNYNAEVSLFLDHSQIVQLECLRSGIWGTKSLWGRVVTMTYPS